MGFPVGLELIGLDWIELNWIRSEDGVEIMMELGLGLGLGFRVSTQYYINIVYSTIRFGVMNIIDLLCYLFRLSLKYGCNR